MSWQISSREVRPVLLDLRLVTDAGFKGSQKLVLNSESMIQYLDDSFMASWRVRTQSWRFDAGSEDGPFDWGIPKSAILRPTDWLHLLNIGDSDRIQYLYQGVRDTGTFIPSTNSIHLVKPRTLTS